MEYETAARTNSGSAARACPCADLVLPHSKFPLQQTKSGAGAVVNAVCGAGNRVKTSAKIVIQKEDRSDLINKYASAGG